jgi:hypothetical protein
VKGLLALDVPEEQGAGAFRMLLEQINNQGFHTVMLLDAFHSITGNTKFDAPFFSFMRSQANHGRVLYVTASTTTLDQCCHPYIEGSPFFNIFQVYHLGPLEKEEARELITRPAQAYPKVFSPEEIEQILLLAGRHPFLIQRVAYYFFREKLLAQEPRARKFKQEAYEDLLPHFKEIWEKLLDARQRELLRSEARWKHVEVRSLPELSEAALFRKFVRDTCDIPAISITPELLEDLLKSLSNLRQLGESDLVNLYLFAIRAKQTQPRTHNERGALVLRLLKDAYERLRPEGEASDTDPEWQMYNILTHRYFKGRMPNELLAERLGISVRTLHRLREQAIETLHQTLFDMEIVAREQAEFEDL